ncbi:MAG: carbamoyl-phosphate synthase large subunit [Bacteriovoracaceae bacterium]
MNPHLNEAKFYENLKQTEIYLHFKDGSIFEGTINKPKDHPLLKEGIWAEAAFTTAMSGYQETMTDPSYLGQHLIFATSHVGNYDSDPKQMQSERVHACSIIASHFSYNEFLSQTDKPLITLNDTRNLIQFLTSTDCSHISVLKTDKTPLKKEEFNLEKVHCSDLKRVGQESAQTLIGGKSPIVLINYGVKKAITNYLKELDLPLVTLPHTASFEEITNYKPRMVFLSNGPGDPRNYTEQVQVIKKIIEETDIPLRGICLGHQLLGLAMGAEVYKLPFGQRGINHPVYNLELDKVLITSQNHGYSVTEESLKNIGAVGKTQEEILVTEKSLFDKSVEAMASKDLRIKSVQYHPESNPGPTDAFPFFKEVKDYLESSLEKNCVVNHKLPSQELNKKIPYKKILLIGSGPIKIGQASEFDYSGTQACKALGSIGIDVVLLNSNPATIMTDPNMAYRTYIEPITQETIVKIIQKEKVDAILSTMGGQTALNICIELEKNGILEREGVQLLGAKVDTIERTEDRELFAKELAGLGFQTGKRFTANDENEATQLAKAQVGYPLIIRRDFALGGKGAALVHNIDELKDVLSGDFKYPITLEKSLLGWKEVELEIMVDSEKQGVVICSIENVDPCGIHTGDSITVAPAQTISDRCLQKMRDISLTVAKHMGVVAGGANVQFAINPLNEDDIVVIEMNPRVSRSSALASKATGYPIAKISALLAVGYTLKEILNDITKVSPVAFEPTLDYVAVKIPIFPFQKFPFSSKTLGPQMRSVGEVLALGGSFTEAFLKALRSLEIGLEIPSLKQLKTTPFHLELDYLKERLSGSFELSLLTALEGLRKGLSSSEIHQISGITKWFVDQMDHLKNFEGKIQTAWNSDESHKNEDILREAKSLGLTDKAIAFLVNSSQAQIFKNRKDLDIFPTYKAVDTCSGEFHAVTPYFYSTFKSVNESISFNKTDPNKESYVILGSGPNRIGQGIEFDYSCVKACQRLSEKKKNSIMINSNPETVSTDYDISNRLYLSPLYSEDLFDIFLNERPNGIVTSFSGQTGIKVRHHLEEGFRKETYGLPFLGANLKTLDLTEDRAQFDSVISELDLDKTKSVEVSGYKKLVGAMLDIGMPVIIRPSYVIGGESMFIFYGHDEIEKLPPHYQEQLKQSKTTFQIENYLENAIEYDVDLVRDKSGNCVFTICEHIEHAGVHSGDSGMVTPPVVLTSNTYKRMKKISIEIANRLEIVGPINFQFAVKEDRIYCIEANPRGSRTLPFLSKAYHVSLPSFAMDALLGEEVPNFDLEQLNYFAVKQSTFPFDRFVQDNIILGPKMRSTGETMGVDFGKEEAILKSLLGNYPKLNKVGKILISLTDKHKGILIPYLKRCTQLGYEFVATSGTYQYIKKQGIPCELALKIQEDSDDNSLNQNSRSILEVLKDENLIMVFNTPMNQGESKSDGEYIRNNAIQYAVPCFTRPENIKAVLESIIGVSEDISPLSLQELASKAAKTESFVETNRIS